MAKTTISVEIEESARKILERRAKKECMSLREMVADILRRSAISYKGKGTEEDKVEDKFLTYFSRKKR